MTTIFQRHAGAEFARFARERMVREQEARRDAETAEAFRAMVEDVSPDHMPNSLDAPCDTFQQTRNAGWAGYCAHCGWSVEFHVTQEGTDARSADATQGDACDLPSYLRDWTRRVLLIIAEDPSDPRIRQAVVGLNALAVRSTNAQR